MIVINRTNIKTEYSEYIIENNRPIKVKGELIDNEDIRNKLGAVDRLRGKLIGDSNLFNFVSDIEDEEDFSDFLSYCRAVVSENLKIEDISNEVALLMFNGSVSMENYNSTSCRSMLMRQLSRTMFYEIIEHVFDIVIIDSAKKHFNYIKEDMIKHITRGEVLYTLFRIIPEVRGTKYRITYKIDEVKELLDGCFSDDTLGLEFTTIKYDRDKNIVLDLHPYLHGVNYSTFLSALNNELAPIPYPLVCCYAEMLKKEIITIEQLGENCEADIFRVENLENISTMIVKYLKDLRG